MSDVKVETKKPDAHGDSHGSAGGEMSLQTMGRFLLWIVAIVFVLAVVFTVVFMNPSTAQMFIKFLQALEVLFLIVIGFCFYKLQDFRKRFLAYCHDIDHLFADKNGQGHAAHGHDDHGDGNGHDHHEHHVAKPKVATNIYEERFYRAEAHITSVHKEEWKIGLVEMDKLLKDLLVKKGYGGDNVPELLIDAKSKGMEHAEDAEIADKTKNYLMRNIVKLPEDKDAKNYKNVAILYKKVIEYLL